MSDKIRGGFITVPRAIFTDSNFASEPFTEVQAYRLAPAGALSRKNISPTPHNDGNVVPDLKGLVALDVEKSTSLL